MGSRRMMKTGIPSAMTPGPRAYSRGEAAGPGPSPFTHIRNAAPQVSPLLLRWFLHYAQGYTSGHFNAVRVIGAEQFPELDDAPLIIYLNHPGWWDPMIAAVLARRYFPDRAHYTPMDAEALAKYKFFSRLGFFGVKQKSAAGARRFLEVGQEIANRRNTVLWITAQGRFSDVRERPVTLAPGLAHLLKYCPQAVVVPMAMEFVYGEERKPEALVQFGNRAMAKDFGKNAASFLELELGNTMDELAKSAIQRDYRGFETILSGKAGVGGVYDMWRSLKARLRREKFDPAHGSK